ncbi:MAG: TonB-dependent receptor [Methylicorpusculum sp.]|uniref:TonB-dependent receptor family protein n=1 Tax=Methylicorpusculum sp. TaxID=2713644 RepID=UPI0027252CB8|nr:TonB-dependent receptor [Methylicorpusculum sp.]MDO8843957.1 TonB-dependent receptor [Methylicorpusculum sp.]MDO8939021.1 TonB-dependent receptor [Methylicorpusculum sp.]MDP2177511.1 TonB-dependent receptor [Methylicorpusculum sp.]MDP2201377.1 TonB-dependent receptor [Methylicorpusculum sp.]MDP3531593.1 TonB-dependent receptor [Methylicorpusculum sp.]
MSLTQPDSNTSLLNAGNNLGLPFEPDIARKKQALITAAVLTALNIPVAMAERFDDAPPALQLPSLEIIGEEPTQLEHIPGSAFVIDKTTLDRQGPLSNKDALRTVPGIHIVDEDVLGRRINIGIRGLDPRRSTRTQLLEDGAPIQLAPYGDPSNHYLPSSKRVDHIEVLKGSGQIMYGPQTVGGAINFVSAPIPEEFAGSISAAGGNNGYYDTHLRMGGTIDNVGLSLDYIRQEADGNRSGQHQEVDDLALKSLIKFNDRHRLMLKGTLTHEDADMGEAGLTSAMYRNNPRTNFLRNDTFEVRRYSGQALYEFDVSDSMQFSTNIYGNHMFRESIRQANDSSGMNNCAVRGEPISAGVAPSCGNEQRPRTYNVFGIEPKLVFTHNLFGVQSETTTGIRGHFEWADRERYVGNDGPRDTTQGTGRNNHNRNRYQDNSLDTQAMSFFAQNRFFLGDFTVTPGIRIEHYEQDNTNHINKASESYSRTEALPGIGATYNGIDNMTLFAGVHRGFAPARIDDVLNPINGVLSQVEPEMSLNYEAGVRTSPIPGITAELTYFRIDFQDQIVNVPVPDDDDFFKNVGESVHQGVETGFRLDSDKLFGTEYNYYLTTSYTYTDAFFDRNVSDAEPAIVKGNRLPYTPEHLINANIGVETPWGLDLRFGVQGVSEQFSDVENTAAEDEDGQLGIIPGYTTYNVSANYQVIKDVNIFMNGYNLSNKKYIASRIDGIQPGQGFQMMGGVKWSF